ncbi:MAG: glycosyl hydrolase family 31 [Bacteroidia bacterium]
MEALKITQTTDSNKLTIDIPDEFISKKLEIIIFPFDEESEDWKEHNLNRLNKAYSIDEPDYNLSMVKEPNDQYGKR